MLADVDQPPRAHLVLLRIGATQNPGLESRLLLGHGPAGNEGQRQPFVLGQCDGRGQHMEGATGEADRLAAHGLLQHSGGMISVPKIVGLRLRSGHNRSWNGR